MTDFEELVKSEYPSPQEIVDFCAIEKRAKDQVLFNKYVQYYNLKFSLGEMGNDPFKRPFSLLRDRIKACKDKLKENNKSGEYLWITINISPDWVNEAAADIHSDWHASAGDADIELQLNQMLISRAEKYANSAMFVDYMFVWEQRKTEEDGAFFKGQHFHFILRRNISYCHSQIVRNTKNMWRKYCSVDNPKILNIHKLPMKYIKDKVDYIKGLKTDDGKPEKVAFDKLKRLDLQISDFYSKQFSPVNSKNSLLEFSK